MFLILNGAFIVYSILTLRQRYLIFPPPSHKPLPFVRMLLLIRFVTTAGRIGGFVVPGLLTGLAAVAIAVLWLLCVVVRQVGEVEIITLIRNSIICFYVNFFASASFSL